MTLHRRHLLTLLLCLGLMALLRPAGAALAATEPGELLLNELVVTPTAGEFVEIHNPTADLIDLSDVYLTDATFAPGGTFYYNLPTGTNAGGGGFADFNARFPAGATIPAGGYQTIAMSGSAGFLAAYGVAPDYELFDDGSNDGEQLMREATPGSINGQGGLTNSGEVVILYVWDGASDLVADLDYAVWGDKDEAVDKTGVSIDGPDPDTSASTYLPDTAIGSQDIVAPFAHSSDNSWQRDDVTEGAETQTGGNGIAGDDETSENVGTTWCEAPPTPGAASVCTPPPPPSDLVINELLADPASGSAGDANGDGVRDFSDDEFVELVNNGASDLDLSGWTLSDGFGPRHTFPGGSVVAPGCAVVVFGGGAPAGAFGGALVQTASSGALGLNNGGDSVVVNDGAADVTSVGYGSEGGNDQSLTRDPDITGALPLVQHSAATGSGGALFSPGTRVDGSAFAADCSPGPRLRFIHEIQGSGTASPFVGETVIIEGVVVGDFQGSANLNGFFVQEEDADADSDPLTSEGIFVSDRSFGVDVTIGDVVRVTGNVNEFFDLTELTGITAVSLVGSGASVSPTIVDLPRADADREPLEGMLVTFTEALSATDTFNLHRFGEVVISADGRQFNPTNFMMPGPAAADLNMNSIADLNEPGRILLDDGSGGQFPALVPFLATDNTLRLGDTVTDLTGIMSYGFGSYRIQPTAPVVFERANPRPAGPADVGGTIRVASFNTLNYWTTIDDGTNNARGADSLAELARQEAKLVAAIMALDADVIGLQELENNGDTAVSALVAALNAAGPDTWAFVPDPAYPGGLQSTNAIKVGIIYRSDRVAPVGVPLADPDPVFAEDRPPVAQTFDAQGEIFTVVSNHFKSKGCGDAVGLDLDQGDGQGCYNFRRTNQALALLDFVAELQATSGDPDVIVVGDLNSYLMEDPITAMAAGMDNLMTSYVSVADQYSLVFFGQAGLLDYAMTTSALTGRVTGVDVWHINVDEPRGLSYNDAVIDPAERSSDFEQDYLYSPDEFRSSDHDPILVGFCDAVAPVLDISLSPNVLWPPQHQYVTVQATVDVSDNFDPAPSLSLLSVTSNEPDNGLGDGDQANDIVILDDYTFQLRAERSGLGDGRVYTITYQATDSCGNVTVASATVTVPKSQRR